MTVYSADGTVDVAARPVEVVDTVGAGDTFIGSVLASLWDLGITDGTRLAQVGLGQSRAIAARATAAAAVTCSRPGADPPHLDEIPA